MEKKEAAVMDYSIISPETFILKMNIHCTCKGCENKLKKIIKRVDGVHSVAVDVNNGKIIVSATVSPEKVINAIYLKTGKKPELVFEEERLKNKNMQIIVQPKQAQVIDNQQILTQLQGLSEVKGLKKVEITYSVKMSLKDNEDGDLDHRIVANEQHGHQAGNFHGKCTCGDNCGVCGGRRNNQCGGGYWPPPRGGYVPSPGPQPLWPTNIPSAPPWPLLPPQVVYGYPSRLVKDDDNQKGCKIV